MGEALKIVFVFNYNFDFSNFIDFLAIVVNSILAIWIVKTIQNKLTNKRVLKDHFISEIKDVRTEYNDYMKDIYADRIVPQETLRWFKLLNVKRIHLMSDITSIYKVTFLEWNNFHTDLRELVTNCPEFNANFRSNSAITFSLATKRKLDIIQRQYNGIFNKLIIGINDAK